MPETKLNVGVVNLPGCSGKVDAFVRLNVCYNDQKVFCTYWSDPDPEVSRVRKEISTPNGVVKMITPTHPYTMFKCPKPSLAEIKRWLGRRAEVKINVGLVFRGVSERRPFHVDHFTAFNCTSFNSCGSCLAKPSRCIWCFNDNQCAKDRQHCKNLEDVIGRRDECPMVSIDHTYIHHEPTATAIKFNALQFNTKVKLNSNHVFSCGFKSSAMHFEKDVSARLSAGKLECSPVNFPLPTSGNEYAVDVTVKTRKTGLEGDIIIDESSNGDDITLVVYACPTEASCFDCLTLKKEYNCGFCARRDEHKCTLRTKCDRYAANYRFFERDMACPNPKFVSVFPTKGLASGSVITIRGENFERRMITHLADTECEFKECQDADKCDWRSEYRCQLGPRKLVEGVKHGDVQIEHEDLRHRQGTKSFARIF